MEENIKITSILQALTKAVAETFKLSTIEAISAVATSKTVARITSNRKAEYSIERERDRILTFRTSYEYTIMEGKLKDVCPLYYIRQSIFQSYKERNIRFEEYNCR